MGGGIEIRCIPFCASLQSTDTAQHMKEPSFLLLLFVVGFFFFFFLCKRAVLLSLLYFFSPENSWACGLGAFFLASN